MQKLPVGMHEFESIRENGSLYVDKTQRIVTLVESGTLYFLLRQRSLWKPLTLSINEVMFYEKI